METLSEDFKLIASENYEFENRQIKTTDWTFFACSAFQHSNLRDKIRDCFILKTIETILPLIQTLMEEIKSVVLEKGELEYRDISKLRALLQLLVNQDSKFQEKCRDC